MCKGSCYAPGKELSSRNFDVILVFVGSDQRVNALLSTQSRNAWALVDDSVADSQRVNGV